MRSADCHPDRKHLARGLCYPCYQEFHNAKRRGKPKGLRRPEHLKALYDMSPEDYNIMLDQQGGVCAICKRPPSGGRNNKYLHVDHCHRTNIVRGLLCSKCNTGIGSLGENKDVLMAAITYLEG